jgi:hypothetical protein
LVAAYRFQKAAGRLFRAGVGVRIAAVLEDVLAGLDETTRKRSTGVKVTLKRADVKNLRWIFEVHGNHTYSVKLKARRARPNITAFSKLDLEMFCSCPAWQWQGPEFHSTMDGYQLDKPRGTAAPPVIRDPELEHRVCKHVAAVLDLIRDWKIPSAVRRKRAAIERVSRELFPAR